MYFFQTPAFPSFPLCLFYKRRITTNCHQCYDRFLDRDNISMGAITFVTTNLSTSAQTFEFEF